MITLRPATPADLPAIQLLATHLAEHVEEESLPVLAPDALQAIYFAANAPMSCAVAEKAGEVVGMVTWMTYFLLHTAQREVYIGDLSVHRQHRGQGIGEELFQHVANLARAMGARKLTWEVWHLNHTAQAFYAKQQGRPVEDEIHYYLDLTP